MHNCLGEEMWRMWNRWIVENNRALSCLDRMVRERIRWKWYVSLRDLRNWKTFEKIETWKMKRSQERAQGKGLQAEKTAQTKVQGGKELGNRAGWRGHSWCGCEWEEMVSLWTWQVSDCRLGLPAAILNTSQTTPLTLALWKSGLFIPLQNHTVSWKNAGIKTFFFFLTLLGEILFCDENMSLSGSKHMLSFLELLAVTRSNSKNKSLSDEIYFR